MRNFDYSNLAEKKFDSSIINLVSHIHECKSYQRLFLDKKQGEVDRLVETAKYQSIEGSNAIEGIITTSSRVRSLVKEKITPKNRNEAQIAGYRDALKIINENYENISLSPNNILYLHKVLYGHESSVSFGGKFKNAPNYIQGINDKGEPFVVFKPLEPFETPIAIESLCDTYNKAIEEKKVDPLILIPIFIHDFLGIHPFTDGNGRMSRLLTTLLLYRSGYVIGKYISLESSINIIRDRYYDTLGESQYSWHEEKDDPTPFIKFMLSIIDMAYIDFEKRVELLDDKVDSKRLVRRIVSREIGKIKKSYIADMCPSLSISSIEKALAELVKQCELEKKGQGKSTYYLKKDKNKQI